MDKERNFHKLFKMVNGVETLLASVSTGYTKSVDVTLQIVLSGNQISVNLDGADVFGGPISDNGLATGTIALYSWGNAKSFYDNVMVEEKGAGFLVAHWTFDDGSGLTAYDYSGNGNDGTLANGPTCTTGKIAGGLNFDGTDDYVNVGSDSSIDEIFVGGGTIAE